MPLQHEQVQGPLEPVVVPYVIWNKSYIWQCELQFSSTEATACDVCVKAVPGTTEAHCSRLLNSVGPEKGFDGFLYISTLLCSVVLVYLPTELGHKYGGLSCRDSYSSMVRIWDSFPGFHQFQRCSTRRPLIFLQITSSEIRFGKSPFFMGKPSINSHLQ